MAKDSSPSIKLTIGNRRSCRICSFPVRLACEVALFIIVFVPLLLFMFQWPRLEGFIQRKVHDKVRLAPGSDGNESWVNSPATTRRAYRLFNITNYMDIMTKTDSPVMTFRETKPFPYKLVIKKNNIEWLENNTKIHYSVERFFIRDGEFSEKLLNQEGAFVDILRNMFRTKFGRVAESLFYILGGNNAFNYSKAVDKIEGYISPIFAAIQARMQGPNREKYGFIYRYNGSNGYNFTILSGINDVSEKGKLVDFESEYTPFKTTANDWQMDIFDGLTFPPVGDPPVRKVINVFQADLCRPVQLRYNRTVSMFGFPKLHEYVLKLINVDECPNMDETCPETDRLDITKCFSAEIPQGTLFLTKPHLYGHNFSSVEVAFKPNQEKHESSIFFEPLSGSPIRARLRIQLNTKVQIDRVRVLDDGSTEPLGTRAVSRFVPMVWIDQSITLNDEVVNRLRRINRIVYRGQQFHQSIRLVYLVLAMICLIGLIALIELFIHSRKNQNRSHREKPVDPQEKEILTETIPSKA